MSRLSFHRALAILLVIGIILPWSFMSGSALAAYTWNDARGPGDGDAWVLVYDGTRGILYRATDSRGVWKYQGGAWSELPGVGLSQVRSLAYDPSRNILYAGGVYGVRRCASPDTVPSWTDMGGGISGSIAEELYYVPDANVLLAGMSGVEGVWACSNPDAATPAWLDISDGGIQDVTVLGLAYDPARYKIYAATFDSCVWRCDYNPADGTWTWTPIGAGLPYQEVDSIAYDPTRNLVYAGLNGGKGVWRCSTPDTSPAWTDTSNNGVQYSNVLAIAFDTTNNVLYCSCQPYGPRGVWGVWSCPGPDSAPSWTSTGGGVSGYGSLSLLYLAGGNTLYAGTFNPEMYNGQGVWLCTTPNTTPSWTSLAGGISDYSVYCYVYDYDHRLLYAGTSNGVWKCSNPENSPTWTSVGLSSVDVFSLAYDRVRNLLYAGMGNYYRGVLRCAEPNTSPVWTNLGSPINQHEVHALACDTTNDRVYAGGSYEIRTGSSVWRCESASIAPAGAGNWIDTGLGCQTNSLVFDAPSGILYAGTGAGVWRCADPGSGTPTWTDITGAMTDTVVYGLAYDKARNLLYAGASGGIWRGSSPNAAAQWTKTNTAFLNVSGLAYDAWRNDLHASTWDDGVWHGTTPDTSPVWEDTAGVLDGRKTRAVECLRNDIVYTGTGSSTPFNTHSRGAWYALAPNTRPKPVPSGALLLLLGDSP